MLTHRVITDDQLFQIRRIRLHFSGNIRHACRQLIKHNGNCNTIVVITVVSTRRTVLIRRCYNNASRCRISLPGNLVRPNRSILTTTRHRLGRRTNCNTHRLRRLARLSLSPNCVDRGVRIILTASLCRRRLRNSRPRPVHISHIGLHRLSDLILGPRFDRNQTLTTLCLTHSLLARHKIFRP